MWEYQLPAGGFATPITYEVDGKQYLAIAAGGQEVRNRALVYCLRTKISPHTNNHTRTNIPPRTLHNFHSLPLSPLPYR